MCSQHSALTCRDVHGRGAHWLAVCADVHAVECGTLSDDLSQAMCSAGWMNLKRPHLESSLVTVLSCAYAPELQNYRTERPSANNRQELPSPHWTRAQWPSPSTASPITTSKHGRMHAWQASHPAPHKGNLDPQFTFPSLLSSASSQSPRASFLSIRCFLSSFLFTPYPELDS
jgi:hypothetical protein